MSTLNGGRIGPGWNAVLLHCRLPGQSRGPQQRPVLDLPLATQFNAFNKWKYLSGRGLVSGGPGRAAQTGRGGPAGLFGTPGDAFRITDYHAGHHPLHRLPSKTSYTWPSRPFQEPGLLARTDLPTDFASRSCGYGPTGRPGIQLPRWHARLAPSMTASLGLCAARFRCAWQCGAAMCRRLGPQSL
jgi:hypothetical protein